MIKPYIIEEIIFKFIKSLIKKDMTIINNKPIIVPSMVLPSLSLGMSLCLPNAFPNRYALVSDDHMQQSMSSIQMGDVGVPHDEVLEGPGAEESGAGGELQGFQEQLRCGEGQRLTKLNNRFQASK